MDELFFQPFTKETGISVTAVDGSGPDATARFQAMIQLNKMEWDIVYLSRELALSSDFKPHFEDLGKSCQEMPNVGAYGSAGSCVEGVAVAWDQGGTVLTYDERAFPKGGPSNWVEFWDLKAFPGPRALPNYGSPWYLLSGALLADGVPREKLFPLDLDRAFKKLDEIKPHVAVWWTSGDQSQQVFRNGEVVASAMWNGRASRLQEEGIPVRFTWDGASYEAQTYSITKGAPSVFAAKALLNFMYTHPEAHAAFMKKMFYAVPNKSALALLDPKFAATLVTSSDNLSKVVKVDPNWLSANRDKVLERWSTWISG
ncbi:hypothetical protein AU467_30015 [Mesorhizobium loti]|uniref:ABC transporter substrate-binding protein n=1 Tax=Rhizobium loti TaxID=381 RepID=A0A101KPB8_RHILI|nr:hypothetical protein AU467_30015 [Mesorhizobium loti]